MILIDDVVFLTTFAMRFVRSAALVVAALCLPLASPFAPQPRSVTNTRLFAQAPCETSNAEFKDLRKESGSAQLLRQATLTNANGELKKLGDAMGPNTSVVIFLRHLG